MKTILLFITIGLIFGLRSTLSFFLGGMIGYTLGHLLVLSGTGNWIIPVLTIVMAFALSRRIKNLLDNLFY